MVIQRMNNVLVKHSKILFGIFTAVIIVSFVWFITPGIDGSLLFGGGISDKTEYGRCFDKKITYGDIKGALRLLSSVSRYSDFPDEQAFFFLVRQHGADLLGASVSDEELRDVLKKIPELQENGEFSPAKYREFAEKNLEPRGLSMADYENALREILRVEKAAQMAGSNVVMSDAEFRDLLREKLEKFSFRFVRLMPELLTGEVKVNEEELQEFFNANKENLLPPARIDGVTAVALNSVFKATVSPETVKAYYEKHKEELKGKDGKIPSLESVSKEITDKLQAQNSAAGARKAMEEFSRKIRALSRTEEYKADHEAMFRAAAKEAGLDLVEVKNAAVDDISPKSVSDPASFAALARLKRPGSVTSPVFGADGCRISLLTGRREFKDTTFEEARVRAEAAYRLAKAQDLVASAAETFRAKVAKSKDPAKDLEAISKECKADVLKFPEGLSRLSIESNPYTAQLRSMLFETKEGTLSLPHTENGIVVMIFVDKREQAGEKEFAEMAAKREIREFLLDEKRNRAIGEYYYWLQTNSRITTPAKRENAAR